MADIHLDLSKCAYLSWNKYYESPEIMVNNGDVLLVKTASVGKCSYVDNLPMEATVNPQILVLKEHKDNAKFLAYIFQTPEGQCYIDTTKGGSTIFTISQEKIGNYFFAFPPLSLQNKIVFFLDEKCIKIDEMIYLQEKIIEELKAYKQSVITEAVTKGLNPDVPMKDSGIEWIGQIPEGWTVKRLKYVGYGENGLTYSPADMCGEEGTLVLRSSNIQGSKLVFTDNVYVSCSIPEKLFVKKGDIIICSRNGSAALVGKCALVEDEINASFGAFMLRFRTSLYNRYAYYLLTGVISNYKQLFSTTTINQLTLSTFNNLYTPVATENKEQQAIADYLDAKCSEIDALITLKQSKIDALKEYKKSIIYEYVTGKKEVIE